MTLWSGRVREGMASEVWSYLLADDAELLPYDLEGTRLHARRLHAAGLLDDAELGEAERILSTMSPADRLRVLDVFGPPPAFPAHDGYAIGGGSR